MHESTLTPDEVLHWLALRLVPGLGSRKAGQLIERFGAPQAVFRASPSELQAAGLAGDVAHSVAGGCAFEEAVAQHEKLLAAGVELIPLGDSRYPRRLREIYDPPVVLFARGRVELLDTMMLGVVGTRRPTPYGVAVAERLSADLARAGLTIVSGMARGIDTAAHRGVLNAGGDTVAVFGCGVDVVYPSENRRLADEIARKGLLLSEFPLGAPAYPQNFPIRNRIISGMSAGVVVVEGAQYSGSSITARLAIDQGREVFAVPGNITSRQSWGPNLLIRQGARLIQDWNDVIADLAPEDRRRLAAANRRRAGDDAGADAPAEQTPLPLGPATALGRRLLDRLKVDAATHVDQLVEGELDSTPSEVIAALFELEMLGMVRQLPGRNFVKAW